MNMDKNELKKRIMEDFQDIDDLHDELKSVISKALSIDGDIYNSDKLDFINESNNYIVKDILSRE